MGIKEELHRFIQPIKRKLALLLGRALLIAVDDSKALQLVRVSLLDSEEKETLERIQNYGFTSVPDKAAEVIVGFVGGSRDNGLVLAVDDSRNRKKDLNTADVCVYRKGGDYVLLKDEGIEVHSSRKVVVDAPSVQLGRATIDPTDGCVTGKCSCMLFTSVPHAVVSQTVKAVM